MSSPLRESLPQIGCANLARYLLVVDDSRRKPTGTQATCCQERNLVVSRRLSRFDIKIALQGREQLGRTFDVASRSHADNASVFTRGFQREEVIEGRDPVSTTEGYPQRNGHIAKRTFV